MRLRRKTKMDDIVGQGYDIVGAGGAPVGVPPYGYGFPAGDPYFPVNNYGWGAINPYAALAAQQAGGMMPQPAPQADAIAGWGGGFGPGFAGPAGFGGGPFGCFAGPVQAPLAIQRNLQPLVGLAPRCPTRSQTQYVGFGSCCIEPCGTVTLRCSPCVLLKVIRFFIPSSIAYQLQVDQITVNGKETLINCGPVPASMFVENATFIETISTETIQPGCCIEIQLTNISDSTVEATVSGICRVMW